MARRERFVQDRKIRQELYEKIRNRLTSPEFAAAPNMVPLAHRSLGAFGTPDWIFPAFRGQSLAGATAAAAAIGRNRGYICLAFDPEERQCCLRGRPPSFG